jgi:hypothetical protein
MRDSHPRETLAYQIKEYVGRLGFEAHNGNYAKACLEEIETPFRASLKVILTTWSIEQLRRVQQHLEDRVIEVWWRRVAAHQETTGPSDALNPKV